MKILQTAVTFLSLIYDVQSHSWAACTDYGKDITGQDYDSDSCSGYIREWSSYESSYFSEDRGAHYQPGGRSASVWCPKTIASSSSSYSSSYTDSYPAAYYTVGETVRVVWPAKNHANYECFGNIPDYAMKIMLNTQVNPSSDPTSYQIGKHFMIGMKSLIKQEM